MMTYVNSSPSHFVPDYSSEYSPDGPDHGPEYSPDGPDHGLDYSELEHFKTY